MTPPGRRSPGWDWLPPGGAEPRLHEAPALARWLFHRPIGQRFAHTWLWRHGYWTVEAAPGYLPGPDEVITDVGTSLTS
jgi:hypothetical protein